jgi:hypothetical protein
MNLIYTSVPPVSFTCRWWMGYREVVRRFAVDIPRGYTTVPYTF